MFTKLWQYFIIYSHANKAILNWKLNWEKERESWREGGGGEDSYGPTVSAELFILPVFISSGLQPNRKHWFIVSQHRELSGQNEESAGRAEQNRADWETMMIEEHKVKNWKKEINMFQMSCKELAQVIFIPAISFPLGRASLKSYSWHSPFTLVSTIVTGCDCNSKERRDRMRIQRNR